ncbi:hypothetical protein YM304_11250 [Ilumatobacter coccineus YM16-304]|uniref:O-antigen ligase-related domain-containing protein n=1 Tax=Ilumatobacter coccineus (strain NBRC 103263 / KCTC 29153 / YM16-304) TaxID=1313172 RepID=A0A6C7E8B6_ILUCY|nr:hypothetical protein YM304_11250 [Ilumatobacter coccineus YM16-304]
MTDHAGAVIDDVAVTTGPAARSVDVAGGSWLPMVAGGAIAGASIVGLDPDGWYPFSVAKWWLVVVAVLGVASAVAWSGGARASCAGFGRMHGALLVLVSVTTVSGFAALDGRTAWIGTPIRHLGVAAWWLFAVALCVGSAVARHRGDARQVQWGVVLAGAVLAAYAMWELVFGRPIDIDVSSDRLGGTYGSPAYLGAACCVLVPVAIGLAADRELSPTRRGVASAVGVGLVFATVGSGSRAAFVGLLATAVVVAVVRRGTIAAGVRRFAGWRVVGIVAAVVGVAGGVAVAVGRGVFERSAGFGTRFDEWGLALRAIAERPLLGAGPEGYRIAAFELVDDDYVRRFGERVMVDRAHSGVLDVAVASGLVAALLYAALMLAVGVTAVRLIGRGGASDVGLGAGLLAFAIGQQFVFPIAEIDPVFWLLVGVGAVRARAVRAETAEVEVEVTVVVDDGSPLVPEPMPRRQRVPSIVIAVVFGLGALAAAVVGVREVAADRLAQQAVTATDPEAAHDLAARAADLAPVDVRHRLLAAQVSAARGSLAGVDDALAAIERAVEISPRDPAVRIEQARVLALRAAVTGTDSDRSAARRAWADLVADAPSCARCHRGAGLAAAERGDVDAAEDSLVRARELGDPEATRLLPQFES